MDQCSKENRLLMRPLVEQGHRSNRGAIVQLDLLVKLEHKVYSMNLNKNWDKWLIDLILSSLKKKI